LEVGPNGIVYAGGDFHLAGGVADTVHIAKWDGSVWTPLGTGADNVVYALAIGPDGCLYAGGDFHNIGGVAATHIAKWNGAAWSALAGGTSGSIRTLAFGPDGTLYAGGVTTPYINKWNGTAWSTLGSAMNGSVLGMIVDKSGALYAGGAFTTAGGVAATYIAKWNGAAWSAVGGGANNNVNCFGIDGNGYLYVGGDFTVIGGITPPDKLAVWNGSTWAAIDCDLPSSVSIYSLSITPNHFYVGGNFAGSAVTSASSTINNPGTHTAYPVLHLKNSTAAALIIYWIKNEITGKTLWFNYTVQPGEELVIDLRPNRRSAKSSYYGSAWRALLRSSDLTDFNLLPGNNQITAYGGSGLTAWMEYRVNHWAADGAAL
jgi:hypothetical protein